MQSYTVYDAGNTRLLDDDTIIEAKSGADAVRQYMKDEGIEGSIKRSGSNFVRFCSIKMIEINGRLYYDGNRVWYEHKREGRSMKCTFCGSGSMHLAANSQTKRDYWQCQGDCGRIFTTRFPEHTLQDSLEDKPLFKTNSLSRLNKARFEKCLEKVYRFDQGTMSLKRWLTTNELAYKKKSVREYAKKKRQGCYAKLKNPVTEYTVWLDDGLGLDVPKLVWDALQIPQETEE